MDHLPNESYYQELLAVLPLHSSTKSCLGQYNDAICPQSWEIPKCEVAEARIALFRMRPRTRNFRFKSFLPVCPLVL